MKKREKIMEYVFLLAAVISIVAVALICIFLFANGIPAMKKIGFVEFLTGTKWKPGNNKFGIFPMILGSIYVTGGALIIGVPVGVSPAPKHGPQNAVFTIAPVSMSVATAPFFTSSI